MNGKPKSAVRIGLVLWRGSLIATGLLLGTSGYAQDSSGQVVGPSPAQENVARMVRLLELNIARSHEQLRDLEGRMPPLQEEIQRLVEQVKEIQPPEKNQQQPEPEPTKEVRTRPPILQLTGKKQVAFVCLEGMISYVDTQAIVRRVRELLGRRNPESAKTQRIEFTFPDSSLRFELMMKGHKGKEDFDWDLFVTNKPDRFGETWEKAQRPESRFRKLLESRVPEQHFVTFVVWPDSYVFFHQVRTLAWEEQFDVGWILQKSGDPVPFGVGGTIL